MNWKEWIKFAGIRALKTVAQTAVGLLSGNLIGITEVDWLGTLSVSAMAGVLSLLTSLAGIPEVPQEHPPEEE
jgi:spore maturation protein SpmA